MSVAEPDWRVSGSQDPAGYVVIWGSYGTLRVDPATGAVLEYDPQGNDREYGDIVRFDPATLTNGDSDILGVGFWDAKGGYTPAMRFDPEKDRWVDV